ncbi:hypothetical protein [Parabacteroides bouchesdurhonensis]|uniref:hypothetical protein n=1 Tax=Parabacteroides bouchesdurhonensis TaxID=1936995 RepID=UPI000C8352D1|nr:hypothetical protein [Parabacteroides bouchesdurhonensis]
MNTLQKTNRPLILLAILMFAYCLPALAKDLEYSKRKEINKSFNVSMSDLLQADNRYGNITVSYWDKKEAAFRIVIEAKSNDESKAQANLDRVEINFTKSGSTVSAITNLKEVKSSFWGDWGDGNNNRLTIQYYINIPNGLAMDLTQKYGNIDLPRDNKGKCNLHVKYGNLAGGNFKGDVEIEAKYSNVNLGDLANADIDLGYAGSTVIGNADELTIDSKYSNLEIQNVKRLTLEKKYGNLKVNTVDKANLEIKYSDITIQSVNDELIVGSLSYSSLNVKELSDRFKKVNVSARYGNLTLAIPEHTAFTVKADNMKYGDFSIKGFNITNSEKTNSNYRSEINNGGEQTIYFDGNGYSNLKIKAK